MTRRMILCAALCGAAASTRAQGPFTTGSTVTYTLNFIEIGGMSNGTLEPGESALVRISLAFSNQNTTATFSPPVGAFSSGTIRGFGWGFVDLIGTSTAGGNANGSWDVDPQHGYGPIDPWDFSGPPGWGTPAAGGSQLREIQFGQFPLQSINTTNPISPVWRGLWTPASYAPRTVTFDLAPAASANGFPSTLLFKISSTAAAAVSCPSDFGSVSIPIIPAPAAASLLVAPLFGRRRAALEPRL